MKNLKSFIQLLSAVALFIFGQNALAGPIILSGNDPEDHWKFGNEAASLQMIQDILDFIHDNATNDGSGILMLGGSNPSTVHEVADLAATNEGIILTHACDDGCGTTISDADFTEFAAIYMPTADSELGDGFGSEVGRGLSVEDIEEINARGQEIIAFVNGGGGLGAFSQNEPNGYQWFPLGGLETTDLGLGGATGSCVTPEGAPILEPSATEVEPFHTTFDGPAGFFGLDVLARDDDELTPECDGPAIIIGGLAVTIQPCEPICEQRTQGFWRRVCKMPHPEELGGVVPYVDDVVALGAPIFDGFDAAAICALMKVSPPENDPCRKARRQFMALLLNIASSRLTTCQDLAGGGIVQDAIDDIKALLVSGADNDCRQAQALAGGINEGTALVPCDSSSPSLLGRVQEPKLLFQNFPNPFRSGTTIRFSLPERTHTTLAIHDVTGRTIATLVNGELTAGTHTVEWEAVVPSGIYFSRLTVGDFVTTRKMVLLR
ncbi:T9SS type A sorting domain-containing protein [candidate division TA06 bacterium]|nr:T9SS type A sorting domain-containing protein [candidate division TA06 bacterium]